MPFPRYIHSVVSSPDAAAWPVEAQGKNECGCTAAANALNILSHAPRFRKDDFVGEAGIFFQPGFGGSLSPVTGWLIKRHGFGTHFGNLSRTDYEVVLRDLIDRGVPAVVEIDLDPLGVYGGHSIVLVGYSDPYPDKDGQMREEYYFVDSQYPTFGSISLTSNDEDIDGDGVVEQFPGNRTMARKEFGNRYPKKIYYPAFPTQSDHDTWYRDHLRATPTVPLLGSLVSQLLTGTYDIWVGQQPQPAVQPS
jgi:hypothetical protein